jgi:holliday junction DNA helicase RuvA
MIAGVRGTLEAKSLDSAFVSVGGVTLRVLAPLNVLANLNVGEQVHLHTYLLVRQDVLALYGFASTDDREIFEHMLAVGGVGPRTGLALLSTMSAAAFRQAVLDEDVQRLMLAPGVGRKLAQRIVMEMRSRVEKMAPVGIPTAPAGASPGASRAAVVEALTNLGYPPAQATAAARSLPEDASGSLEDLILLALRSLARE